jgi:hypothetical protein
MGPSSPALRLEASDYWVTRFLRGVKKLSAGFPRRLRPDRQRVHGARQFLRQRCINHAVAFDSALPFEGGRYNIKSEMRLAARPVAGMAFMKM